MEKENKNWQKEIVEKKNALRQLSFGGGVGKTKDVKLAQKMRHEIARLLTSATKAQIKTK